jgi:hypothetical protein
MLVSICPSRMFPFFSESLLLRKSSGRPFRLGPTFPQQRIFFVANSSNNSSDEKKMSMCKLCPAPSILLQGLVREGFVTTVRQKSGCKAQIFIRQ